MSTAPNAMFTLIASLHFLSCLCASKERDIQLNLQLREALEVGLRERIGLAGDSLDIAIRTLVC